MTMRKIPVIEDGPVITFSDKEYATIPPEWSGPELAPEIETVEITHRCGHTLVHQFYRSADHSERDAIIETRRGRDCYVCEQGCGMYPDTVRALWRMIAGLTTENKRSREEIEKLRTVLDMRVLEVEEHRFNARKMQHEFSYQGKPLAVITFGITRNEWECFCQKILKEKFRLRSELTKKIFEIERKYASSEESEDA